AVEAVALGRGVGLRQPEPDRLALLDRREVGDDHLLLRRHLLAARGDAGGLELRAGEDLGLQGFAGIEDPARRFGGLAPGPDDVEILVGAFARLGVVVIQAERVRFGRLQEVDDIAVLVGALGQPVALGRPLRLRAWPPSGGTGRARWTSMYSPSSSASSRPCALACAPVTCSNLSGAPVIMS